jgi:hypothetical protein
MATEFEHARELERQTFQRRNVKFNISESRRWAGDYSTKLFNVVVGFVEEDGVDKWSGEGPLVLLSKRGIV